MKYDDKKQKHHDIVTMNFLPHIDKDPSAKKEKQRRAKKSKSYSLLSNQSMKNPGKSVVYTYHFMIQNSVKIVK